MVKGHFNCPYCGDKKTVGAESNRSHKPSGKAFKEKEDAEEYLKKKGKYKWEIKKPLGVCSNCKNGEIYNIEKRVD